MKQPIRHPFSTLLRSCALLVLITISWLPAQAQDAPVTIPVTAPPTGAQLPATVELQAPPESQEHAEPQSCRILTDRAMAADLRSAQALKADEATRLQLIDASIGLWTLATERCDGRARERAQRNLDDSYRSRQALTDAAGDGPECLRGQKDAASLQDLAAQALKERRWQEAALLYRKAESQWDVTAERCIGDAQRQAEQRREQTVVDAHNAAHCAPIFEKARQAGLALRRQAPALPPAERAQRSQGVETLWRSAQTHCKAAAQDLARTQADSVAKERGTPWVPTADAGATGYTGQGAVVAAGAVRSAEAPTTTVAGAAATGTATGQEAAEAATGVSAPVAPAVAPSEPQQLDITAGSTRFTGQFVQQEKLLTGTGRVAFPNGDVYIGALVSSRRHGTGEMVWANGQRYQGEWVADEPQGQGTMVYASGDRFTGQHRQGRADGHGTYTWANGQVYEGPWSNEHPNGKGKLRFAQGDLYEGELRDGHPHGRGHMRYPSGEHYEGDFAQGRAHGQGRYTWTNGDHYQGAWVMGKKQGQGRYTWANGNAWEGKFDQDSRTSEGTMHEHKP